MTSFRIRPRFRMEVEESPKEVEARFRKRAEAQGAPCSIVFFPQYIVLTPPVAEQQFWSPRLEVHLEEQGSGTFIRAWYGPSPHVWTFFTLGYGAIAILMLFLGIMGFSQWSLGMNAPILWALPVLAGAAVFLYIMGQTGQKLGAEQTFDLHHFFEETMNRKVPLS
ncbi:MAG: hypothetical protein IPN20_04140 [Haliscomenobacter sp.]|nr:hypothetical protein [Haliscomenobacter sp.]MBK8653093.1 hypothetical protein [Haliscomenobacter sp.]